MVEKILCATDGSEHSNKAVDLAADMATKLKCPVTFVLVNTALGGIRGPVGYQFDDVDAEKILATATGQTGSAGAKGVKSVVLKSRLPAFAIMAYAEENGYDFIVVGTGDRRGVSRLVLGSVAADVASRAHCTVAVAR
jgi:nucleotide-binding universal stress UspA family protein